MEMVVLIIHLLVCICLIGLVLLQRSEGGALGMGGGGGSLMSGRGAADALARMTSVAGGFFLVTSLGLTVLSGAAANAGGGSVLDNFTPRQERTVTPPVDAAPIQPDAARPDPTESSAPQAAETQLASIATPIAPAPSSAAPRAAPLGPSSAVAATPPPAARTAAATPRRTEGTTVPASATTTRAPAATTTRSSTPTTTPVSTSTERPLVIPNTSGSVTGITLTDDAQSQPESLEIGGGGVEAVRRERAGPDQ